MLSVITCLALAAPVPPAKDRPASVPRRGVMTDGFGDWYLTTTEDGCVDEVHENGGIRTSGTWKIDRARRLVLHFRWLDTFECEQESRRVMMWDGQKWKTADGSNWTLRPCKE